MARKMTKSREQLLEDSFAARTAAWSRWGTVESDVLSHAINPSFMGGPRWPALRQAYRVVRKGKTVILASDGLSDPYDEDEGPQDQNGVGVEVFAATDEIEGEGVMSLAGTWLNDMVYQMSQNAANKPQLAPLLDELGLLTMELYDVGIPKPHQKRFLNEEGRVTILMSAGCDPVPTRIAGPLSPIRFVHLQLLTVDELRFVLDRGDQGRRDLVAALKKQKIAPLSRLNRPSVV